MHARGECFDIELVPLVVFDWQHLGRVSHFSIGKAHLITISQPKAKDVATLSQQKRRVLATSDINHAARLSRHFTKLDRSCLQHFVRTATATFLTEVRRELYKKKVIFSFIELFQNEKKKFTRPS